TKTCRAGRNPPWARKRWTNCRPMRAPTSSASKKSPARRWTSFPPARTASKPSSCAIRSPDLPAGAPRRSAPFSRLLPCPPCGGVTFPPVWGRGHSGRRHMDILRILIAVLLPPLGVFLQVGFGGAFWLNILLTLLGYLPGVIHAVYIIA